MKNGVSLLGVLGVAVFVGGCTELGPIGAGTCGNGVLEQGEDCDQSGGGCIPPGDKFECRFTCENASECKAGWRCGADAVCREPKGTFRTGESIPADLQLELSVAELDGRQPADLLSVSLSGQIAVTYGGSNFQDVSRFQSRPFRPASGNLTEEDSAADVVHVTDAAIGVLLGSEQKSLKPVAYSPIAVKDGGARFLMLEGKLPVLPKDPTNPKDYRELRFYAFDEILEIAGNEIRDSFSDKPNPVIATLPFDSSLLLPFNGDIPFGKIDHSPGSPCDELVLMQAGGSQALIYSPCKLGGFAWNDDVNALPPVTLPPGVTLGAGGSLADLDGDGELDLLLVSSESLMVRGEERFRTYVAYGAGDGTFNSTLPVVAGATDNKAAPAGVPVPAVPLAAGDINGDGKADFVFANTFVFSRENCPKLEPECYDSFSREYGGFSFARIGDFNDNGKPDVVAISPAVRSVYFFNGTGSDVMNLSQVPTGGYPGWLATGDFDGDLVTDVAITEIQGGLIGATGTGQKGGNGGSASGQALSGEAFSVLFGKKQGAPEPPVRMGELGVILGVASGDLAFQGHDTMADVGVLTLDQTGTPSVALFGGASSRQMQSPFNLTKETDEPDIPVAVAVGQFTAGDTHRDIAALAFDTVNANASRLWLVPSTGQAALSVGTTSVTALSADVDPCSATLVPVDLDADGRDEVIVIGSPKELAAQGTRFVVARSDGNAWKLDPPVDFAELKVTSHPVTRAACRAAAFGKEVEEKEGRLGWVAVGDVDASGTPDLVIMTFEVTGELGSESIASSLIVLPDAKLDAASALQITLPENTHPVTFTLLDADADPELELAYFALEGTFVADLNVSTKTLTNIASLQEGVGALYAFEDNPPMNLASADFDGDGMPDLAMGYLLNTQFFYGEPVMQ